MKENNVGVHETTVSTEEGSTNKSEKLCARPLFNEMAHLSPEDRILQLILMERGGPISPRHHEKQVSFDTRAALADWILEFVCVFNLELDVFADSVSLMDLTSHLFLEEHRQEHAAVCVHIISEAYEGPIGMSDIAMACESGSILGPRVFHHLSDIVFSESTSRCPSPTVLHFVRSLCEILEISEKSRVHSLLQLLSVESLYVACSEPISKQGFGLTSLALLLSNEEEIWPQQLQELSPYSWPDIKYYIIKFFRVLRQLDRCRQKLKMVDQKRRSFEQLFHRGTVPTDETELRLLLAARSRNSEINIVAD